MLSLGRYWVIVEDVRCRVREYKRFNDASMSECVELIDDLANALDELGDKFDLLVTKIDKD